MDRLPREIQGEILSKIDTIVGVLSTDVAIPEYKDLLHKSIERLSSEYYTEVSIDYLQSFPRLKYTYNIGVRVDPTQIHLLGTLPELRRMTIHVAGSCDLDECVQRLYDVLRIQEKADDQYWRIYIESRQAILFVRNRVTAINRWTNVPTPTGFTYIGLHYRLAPSAFIYFLDEVKTLPPVVRDVVVFCTRRRVVPRYIEIRILLRECKKCLGEDKYRQLVVCHMHQAMHARRLYDDKYYTDPDALAELIDDGTRPEMLEFYDIPKDTSYPSRGEKDVLEVFYTYQMSYNY